MKIAANYHTHTNFCDGKNCAEEMVLAAIKAGFSALGFSGHSYTPFDLEACMTPNETSDYIEEIQRLQKKYNSYIEIFCGIEKDYYSDIDVSSFDYVIGSVHYIRDEKSGKFYSIDNTREELEACLQEVFAGNALAMVQKYYSLVAYMAQKQNPDILGHFDLIKKLNGGNRYFDESSPEYQKIAVAALKKAAASGCIFEINSGGLYKKYTEDPYPAAFLLKKLAQLQTPIIISSDAHDTAALDFYFAEMAASLWKLGFKDIMLLNKNGFYKQPLR
jgi:histidinol-phosphatase (PHP family)